MMRQSGGVAGVVRFARPQRMRRPLSQVRLWLSKVREVGVVEDGVGCSNFKIGRGAV